MHTSREHTRARLENWFASYSSDHLNPTNQRLHIICVPLILWAVVALLWCIPVPGSLFGPGAFAALAMFLTWSFYYRHSRALGAGMMLVFIAFACGTHWLYFRLGAANLAWLAFGVFALAWVGQFVGHHIEGRRPSFLTDLTYLLVGPVWVLAKLYRRLRLPY